jgi:hypothetical protein
MDVYNLTCEDASHLGGPMGTEYTTHVFTKPFTTLQKAKDYAKKYHKGSKLEFIWPEYAKWEQDSSVRWHVDAGAYIFEIKKEKVE